MPPPLLPIGPIRTIPAGSEDERNNNLIANSERIKQRVEERAAHERIATLCCYGPSLKDTWPLVAMDKLRPDHDVFSVSGAHDFLLGKNVIPFGHLDCDPRARKGQLLKKPNHEVKYWLASCVHPSYVNRLEGYDVSIWHAMNTSKTLIWDHVGDDEWFVIGGGCIGLRALSVLYINGYRKFHIHGFDCSFQDGAEHAGDHNGVLNNKMTVQFNGQTFETSAGLISYARQFEKILPMIPGATFELHGKGLFQTMWGPQ
jgi:Protein of unknown function DUF115